MLFNSYIFIFVFLPATLVLYHYLQSRKKQRAAITTLVLASLFFYGWWNPAYLLLLGLSVLFNYKIGRILSKKPTQNKTLLIIGIAANLSALGYFKYANFFLGSIATMANHEYDSLHIILPLAISFFTFQQISYLMDAHQGSAHDYNFIHYCLFVTFFPQLIAGPIVHHKEMMPQFDKPLSDRHRFISIGFTIFIIGLFKKVMIADSLGIYASPVFHDAAMGYSPYFFEAWGAALAYTFQLYFDFSGYSDMAVGLAYMFGISLPINFLSPYKASNIIDFWRRWHITLSRFLRDYLYIPLGGNRKGIARRYVNLFITMLLGGLWHGANWTFIVWGGLHGFFLCINHGWHAMRKRYNFSPMDSRSGKTLAWITTFLCITVSWVVFRAENWLAAEQMLSGMAGLHGITLKASLFDKLGLLGPWLQSMGVIFTPTSEYNQHLINQLLAAITIAFLLPNTYEFFGRYSPAILNNEPSLQSRKYLAWKPSVVWAIGTLILAIWTISSMSSVSEFLYYQF